MFDPSSAVVSGTGSFLVIGFGLGIVHAFDADHVAAMCALAFGPRRGSSLLRAAVQWAAGHGITLLGLAFAAFAVGIALPASLSWGAEVGIGLLLVGLGTAALVSRRAPAVHAHEDGDVAARGRRPAAVLVGALHGLSGSALVLSLVPAVARGSAPLGLAYVASFSLGVLVALALVGALVTRLLRRMGESSIARVQPWLRGLSGLASIAVGVLLLGTTLGAG